jgi:hypothetical protein
VVFDVDPVLASQLKDAKFQFVAKPTAEGEQDAADDQGTQTGGNQGGGSNTGGNNDGGHEVLEG